MRNSYFEHYIYIREIQYYLQSGLSLRAAVDAIPDSKVSKTIKTLVISFDRGLDLQAFEFANDPLLQSYYSVLIMGLKGHSILDFLKRLELSFYSRIEENLQKVLAQLPFKAMLPILFFLFPAYLLVLLGPIINQFLEVL